tara:strand:- start:1208 stop:1456 length:249 start_codon:yes stop_codon:yes gene_type:complete
MKCSTDSKCPIKCLSKAAMIFASVIIISVLVKLSTWILDWFSHDIYLNTAVVIFATIVTFIGYSKCCAAQKNECCNIEADEK